ncbi:LytS/YhcK type 5TM receptor domain-containing protein [Klebsiella pneumoniae]|uniref:LytS/YhcK type 5TM receptor domain-containing protein n=1 Tax=Klebsiella pneumoniae TaxID=573 RepID=UPI00398673DE
MLICLFFLIRLGITSPSRLFRELLHKSAHTPKELLAVTAIFSLFALFSTWSGVPVEGSLVNVPLTQHYRRDVRWDPVWSLGGRDLKQFVGAIAGVHRYLIDIDGVTAAGVFQLTDVALLYQAGQHCRRFRMQLPAVGVD